jgi:hypothetical protein
MIRAMVSLGIIVLCQYAVPMKHLLHAEESKKASCDELQGRWHPVRFEMLAPIVQSMTSLNLDDLFIEQFSCQSMKFWLGDGKDNAIQRDLIDGRWVEFSIQGDLARNRWVWQNGGKTLYIETHYTVNKVTTIQLFERRGAGLIRVYGVIAPEKFVCNITIYEKREKK